MFCINDCHNCIKAQLSPNLFINEECLCYWCWIRKPCRFNEDVVELVATLHQCPENSNQVSAHGATDAPIVHFKDFFFSIDDQCIVNTDLTEFVFDHSDSLTVILTQDVVHERGLATSQEPRHDSHRYAGIYLRHILIPSC